MQIDLLEVSRHFKCYKGPLMFTVRVIVHSHSGLEKLLMAGEGAKESNYLFIDNDVSSMSSSKVGEPQTRFAVNRHVQRWRAQKSTSYGVVTPYQETQTPKLAQRVFRWRLKRPQGRQTLQPAKYSNTLLMHQLDSFTSIDVQLDTESHGVFQYFVSKWTPSACKCTQGSRTPLCTWPGMEIASTWPQKGVASMEETVRKCLFNQMHMYALLAANTGRMKYVTRDHIQRLDLPEFYMAKAICMLRTYLTQCQILDQQCLLDLFFFCSFETYAKNYHGAQIYLGIIKEITERFFGNIDIVEEHVRKLCWNADLRVAFICGTQPVFRLSWDPGPLSSVDSEAPPAYRRSASIRAKTGSVLIRVQTISGPPLHAIVEDLIECAEAARDLLSAERDIDRQRIIDRATAILHRLISIPAPQGPASAEKLREECCRQGLILWTWNILIGSVSGRTGLAGLQHLERMTPLHGTRLKKAIRRTTSLSDQCWSEHNEVLFWLVILGAAMAGQEGDQPWFAQEMRHLANSLEVRQVLQLSSILFDLLDMNEAGKAALVWPTDFLQPGTAGSPFDEPNLRIT
jgi:hypothetical protein